MRETDFISQNKDKWQEFEKLIRADSKDPEKLSGLFIEVTDDLSFSRTYYPNRSVRVYLNGIAQTVFQNIYRNKKSKVKPFKRFWTITLPDTMWRVRWQMFWSMLIFVVSVGVGYMSSAYNSDFGALILGDGYVEMSKSNVESGDPFKVYKDSDPLEMFYRIGWNNIQISFGVFVLGLLAGAGTIWVILSNGIMFGAFVHFFVARGLLVEFSTVVMLHGTLELSMIVLAGAAGLTLGRGLLFPKSYNRLQSLVLAARRGVQIMVPTTIFLVLAAFIESWITRHTEVAFIWRFSLVFASVAIVLGYFVLYPWYRYRKGYIEEEEDDQLQTERDYDLTYHEVKTSGKIFTEIFYFYKTAIRGIARRAFFVSILMAASFYLLFGTDVDWVWDFHSFAWLADLIWPWNEIGHLFRFHRYPMLMLPFAIAGAFVMAGASRAFFTIKEDGRTGSYGLYWLNGLITLGIMFVPWLADDDWNPLVFVLIVFLYPLMLIMYTTACSEGKFLFAAIGRTFELLGKNFGRMMGLFWVVLAVPWIVLLSAWSMIFGIIIQVVEVLWMQEWLPGETLGYLLFVMFCSFLLALVFPVMLFGYHLCYFNFLEIAEATHLRKRIGEVKFRSKAFGLEKE